MNNNNHVNATRFWRCRCKSCHYAWHEPYSNNHLIVCPNCGQTHIAFSKAADSRCRDTDFLNQFAKAPGSSVVVFDEFSNQLFFWNRKKSGWDMPFEPRKVNLSKKTRIRSSDIIVQIDVNGTASVKDNINGLVRYNY